VRLSRTRPLTGGASRGVRRGLVQRLRAHDSAARAAIASFLWATLLGPALHLIDHRADHAHGPGLAHLHPPGATSHVHPTPADRRGDPDVHPTPADRRGDPDVHPTPYQRGDPGHHRPAARRTAAPVQPAAGDPQDGPGAPAGPHGAGAALHFALALLEGVAPVELLPPVALVELSSAALTSDAPRPPRDAAHRPRGPPAPVAILA
jgi:hypothetical protein